MISVLMSVFNEKLDWIKQSVESILNQSYSDIEFIIVIDNPVLESKIKTYITNLTRIDCRVIVLWNEVNIGLAKSLNRALNISSGEYIARMDADDISKKDRLLKELEYLVRYDFDMVSANKINIDESGNELDYDPPILRNPNSTLQYSNVIVHPLVLIKTKVIKQLGGYRPLLNSEDFDLWLRIVDRGYKIGILNEYLLEYRIRSNSASIGRQLEQYYTTKYIITLDNERKKTGKDSFSLNNQKKFLDSCDFSEAAEKKLKKSDEAVKKALYAIEDKKYISATVFMMKAFAFYPQYTIEKVFNQVKIARDSK